MEWKQIILIIPAIIAFVFELSKWVSLIFTYEKIFTIKSNQLAYMNCQSYLAWLTIFSEKQNP